MRIAVDGRSLSTTRTGVGTYTENLLEQLLRLDPELEMVLVIAGTIPRFSWLENPRVQVVRSSLAVSNNFIWSNLLLRKEIRRCRPQLFHSPGYTLPLWPPTRAVVTLHDVSYAAQPQWYPYRTGFLRQWWYRSAALQADAVITDSDFSRTEIERVYRVPPNKIHRIYPGVDRQEFKKITEHEWIENLRQRYGLAREFLLFVGDIHPRRNLARIVAAFRLLRESSPRFRDLELVLIGRHLTDPTLRSDGDSHSTYGLAVRILGYVPREDLVLFYSSARAFLFPSFYEGFGLPVLEAMSCGCPVIVSRGTACEEIAGCAGTAVDPNSVKSIAEAAEALLVDRGLAAKHSALGLQRAEEFSWEKTAGETHAVYQRLVQG